MKRIFLFVLTFALLLSCAACAPETEPAQDSVQDAAQTDQTDETPEEDAAGEESPESEEPEEEPAQPEETDPETETDDASDSPAREPLEAGSLAGQLGLESGLLSTEEVAAVEQLLGAGEEEILAALSLTEADVDTESSDESRLTLAARRDLLGTECYQTFCLSLSESVSTTWKTQPSSGWSTAWSSTPAAILLPWADRPFQPYLPAGGPPYGGPLALPDKPCFSD